MWRGAISPSKLWLAPTAIPSRNTVWLISRRNEGGRRCARSVAARSYRAFWLREVQKTLAGYLEEFFERESEEKHFHLALSLKRAKIQSVLTGSIAAALRHAHYELMENGRFFGSISQCEGAWAEAETLEACREELRGALESWIVGGLRHGDQLPVLDGIDLNPRELVDA